MRQPYYLPGQGPGPLQTILAAVAGALVLLGSFFFGFFILVTVLGLVMLAAIAFRLRLWWLKRRMERELNAWCETRADEPPSSVIEGEVVRKASHHNAHEQNRW